MSTCGNCRSRLDESPQIAVSERKRCPQCGSTSRVIEAELRESVKIREMLRMKVKRPGFKRPIYEDVSGAELHRDSGRWRIVQRSVDQLKNWYYEKITDAETGAVMLECDEPLGEHQGHGVARSKKTS
jgi:PHP family Zn ribbon phosphoesterase